MDNYSKNGHAYNNKLYQKLLQETLEYNKNSPTTRVSDINYYI